VPAIGFGLAWVGYTLMLLGWGKVKGYPVTVADLVVPGRLTSWPPPGAGKGIGGGKPIPPRASGSAGTVAA
jgi:hypothetical protein